MTNTYGFELLKEQHIPELNTHAFYYRHLKSGAELLSLVNDDENKVFGAVFRTPPTDSTGLPHIMEHATLCGSEKYPVKEPFVELLKGSLNTFLNAFTYPDKTCYPVASQNLQDFYNLVDVYLDAVFHPLIPPHILEQEGWHYELDDIGGELAYKGVVFNEMKGAYSDPDSILDRYARQSVFPDNPYSFDYGGDPTVIPELTYDQFKDFHETYYHPSNVRLFFYGDDDPQERLRLLDANLADYEAIQVDSTVPLQPRFTESRRLEIPYDPGDDPQAGKGRLVINWLMPGTEDPQQVLSLQMLSHILLATPASPLRKALIDSGLGEDLVGGGLEWQLRQMVFSAGLKGFELDKAGDVEELILDTLEDLARNGIDPDTVAASLNTYEFSLRENNTGSFPRGLWLMLRSLTNWLYDGDPFAPLAFEAPLTAIKTAVENDPTYFERLIQEHILDNMHRTIVRLIPESGLGKRIDEAEIARLAQARSKMNESELQAIAENTQRLKQIQEAPDTADALATIPSLSLADLDRESKKVPLEISEHAGAQVLYHDLFTNGIVYLDVGFDLHTLPQELLPYIPLFGRSLLQIGTENQDFVKLSQRIGRETGGIYPSTYNSAVQGESKSVAWLFLRGKATIAQTGELLDILRDVLLTVSLDNQARFRQMLLESKARREASLVPGGHGVINTRLRALFGEAGWFREQTGGVDYLFFLRDLIAAVENDWPTVLANLERIRQILINRNALVCNITLDADNWKLVQPQVHAFFESLPDFPVAHVEWRPAHTPQYEGLTIPSQVNYVGKGANLYDLGYQPHGSISVISNYLQTTWLWERVRVQGGAYGGFCLFSRLSGGFTYLSYRDPNLLGTIDNFDGSVSFLRNLDLSQGELTKSIIGVIGDLDAYQLPDAKGYASMSRYLAGVSDQNRQQWREQVLSTTSADFREFADVLAQLNSSGAVVVLGSPEAIEAANKERAGWLTVRQVL